MTLQRGLDVKLKNESMEKRNIWLPRCYSTAVVLWLPADTDPSSAASPSAIWFHITWPCAFAGSRFVW